VVALGVKGMVPSAPAAMIGGATILIDLIFHGLALSLLVEFAASKQNRHEV
jgi:hypothetical protein